MIHHSHPEVKPEQLRSYMLDPKNAAENMRRVNDAFAKLNVGDEKSFVPKKGEDAKKKTVRKAARIKPMRNSR